MVVDLRTLADTLVSGTREGQIEKEIRDNAGSMYIAGLSMRAT
jgi:hypothetical protein